MPFRYCARCNDEFRNAPTAREDLVDGQFCENGHRQPQWQSEAQWIVDLAERLDGIPIILDTP